MIACRSSRGASITLFTLVMRDCVRTQLLLTVSHVNGVESIAWGAR